MRTANMLFGNVRLPIFKDAPADGKTYGRKDREWVEVTGGSGTDEKVKYDAADPTAGYLSEKIVAGANITIEEGTGADENKVKISAVIPDSGITVEPEYGNLYNWYVTQEDIAPTGWHVPTIAEWLTLNTIISSNVGKLKMIGFNFWNSPNTGATNELNFNAVGTGGRNGLTGEFGFLKEWCPFVSSDIEISVGLPYTYELGHNSTYASGSNVEFTDGVPLRFIKDDSTDPGTVTDYDGNEYATVKIGDQVWMAENFRGTHYNDGSPIDGPDFTDEEWAALTTPAYCIYKQTLEEKLADIDHNSTKNKQGGDEENNEFYHLTAAEKTKVENLATVATSGSYNDLSDKPTDSTTYLGLTDTSDTTYTGKDKHVPMVNEATGNLDLTATEISAVIHVGTTPPADTTKLWYDTN